MASNLRRAENIDTHATHYHGNGHEIVHAATPSPDVSLKYGAIAVDKNRRFLGIWPAYFSELATALEKVLAHKFQNSIQG